MRLAALAYLRAMKHQALMAVIAAFALVSCGHHLTRQQQMAWDRAEKEVRHVLKYPDASEWPAMDKVEFRQNGDTVVVTFSVLAPNAFGVKSSEYVSLDMKVDSCARVVGGILPGDRGAITVPDPEGMCDFYAALQWRRAYRDSVDSALWAMPPEEAQAYLDSSIAAIRARSR